MSEVQVLLLVNWIK